MVEVIRAALLLQLLHIRGYSILDQGIFNSRSLYAFSSFLVRPLLWHLALIRLFCFLFLSDPGSASKKTSKVGGQSVRLYRWWCLIHIQ